MVFHDARLDRVTDRSGAIAELTVADVEAADAGYVFSPDGGRTFPYRGRGVRIPRLEELLVRWPEECINIDPKSDACVAPLVDLMEPARPAADALVLDLLNERSLRAGDILETRQGVCRVAPRLPANSPDPPRGYAPPSHHTPNTSRSTCFRSLTTQRR